MFSKLNKPKTLGELDSIKKLVLESLSGAVARQIKSVGTGKEIIHTSVLRD